MTQKEIIMTDITRYHSGEKLSRVVVHNVIVYLCGQVAADYNDHPTDITAQTKSVLKRIDDHLAEAGTDKSRILSATVYLRDIKQAAEANKVWNAWLADCTPPARTAVQAELAKPEILIEITLQAALAR
jgi:enamine deaminase RidA (YjgF/YER057c/UK114 family)